MGFDSVRDADQFRKWIKKDDGSVASVVAMTACGDNEYALESRASASANGFFTTAFVEALRHAPVDAMVRPQVRTDAAAHGFVLGHKLFDGGGLGDGSIVDKIREFRSSMSPMYRRIEEEHFGLQCEGDFIFYVPDTFLLSRDAGADAGSGEGAGRRGRTSRVSTAMPGAPSARQPPPCRQSLQSCTSSSWRNC